MTKLKPSSAQHQQDFSPAKTERINDELEFSFAKDHPNSKSILTTRPSAPMVNNSNFVNNSHMQMAYTSFNSNERSLQEIGQQNTSVEEQKGPSNQ